DPQHRGEFLERFTVDTMAPTVRVATGDVNGDGKADLVTLDEASGEVEVFLQTSSSPLSFAASPAPIPMLGACAGLVLGDFDRDGKLDIVSVDAPGSRLLFLYGGGAAGFMLRESPTKASLGRAMAVGDVDGDGWPDVCVCGTGGTSVVCMLQNPSSP